MIEVEAELKAWGNSAGFIIPHKIMEELKLSIGDKVKIELEKKNPLEEIWGKLKGVKPQTNKTTRELIKEFNEGLSKHD